MRNICDFEVGDHELREMIFSDDSLAITFRNTSAVREFTVYFSKVEYVTLESNLMQNVIENIVEFNIDECEHIDFLRIRPWISALMKDNSDKYKCIYIEPIAGAEMVIICDHYNIVHH